MINRASHNILDRKVEYPSNSDTQSASAPSPQPAAHPPAQNLFAEWREDVACVFGRDPAARTRFEVLTTYPGLHAVLMHRLNHRLWLRGFYYAARLLAFLTRLWSNIDIHPGATIGRRFFIDHGAGVVIGETAEIGNDVTLYHGVTLGGTSWNKGKRHPTLGDGVLVGAGAKILGPIALGDNVRVGANSVVVKNVPPNRTVVGIPGRVIQPKEGVTMNPHGIDLDHNHIPDVVNQTMADMMARIETLENLVAATTPPENNRSMYALRSIGNS
ncbi:serine O-acetyltransferase [Methylocaldum sp.]|uniref:serine O-acetyltransferase n=1 Tax=Methylocaldum sp. TaxID=1969727 RepID=UPI002D54A3B1|nr:serine O-acetyltransferase [Methylocaldum sp.]HYE37547.1 serine O-acetyltransferase [Methylocaldum sp.]